MDDKPQILVVDDNVSLRRTLSLVLRHKGYAVCTAGDGPEAIEKVRERAFDVIFIDIKLPAMDGVEAYKRIKQIRSPAAVIMMTAYAVEDLVEQALQEGAHDIFYKPLDIERVLTLVEQIMSAG